MTQNLTPRAEKRVREANTVMKSETRYQVRNIKIHRGEVATLRFRLLPAKQMVKVSSAGHPAIMVERLGRKQFLAAPKGELPRLGATPGEAMQKAIKRYW